MTDQSDSKLFEVILHFEFDDEDTYNPNMRNTIGIYTSERLAINKTLQFLIEIGFITCSEWNKYLFLIDHVRAFSNVSDL